jgi:hypothetical protein
MSASPNLKLPYIDANQNQKSVTHNAALTILDALVNLQVQSNALTAPPASLLDGQCWIVASGGSGAWLGKDLNVAAWQDGAWNFYAPNRGFIAYVDAINGALMWNGTAWVSLLGAISQLSLNELGLGTAVDPNNPLSAILNSALFAAQPTTASGTGHVRLTLSKQAAANTASILLQDHFSGRAEIGLTGDDNLHVKVSPDGATFYDALDIAAANGAVSFLLPPAHPSPPPSDTSSASATTAWVAAKGFVSAAAAAAAAPVQSVAGRTGAVTLSVTDVSGAAPLSSPTLTGTPAAPTATAGTATTQIATTSFVASSFVTYSYASANYATLSSPTLTGTPTAPTPAASDNSTKLATTAFVAASFSPLASPVLTGTPTAPTAAAGTNSTQIATTSFVAASYVTYTYAAANYATLANASLTGTPTAPTPSVGDNSTKLATTAYVTTAVTAAFARTQISDANYTALATDRTVAYIALTAARTISLPAASAYAQGATLTVVDESGACSATKTITINRAGSDAINGAASVVLSSAYAYLAIESNGSNKWSVIDQSTLGMAQQAASNVAITGGTINGTTIGLASAAAGTFTALTTTANPGLVAIPPSTPTTPATSTQLQIGEATNNSAYRLSFGYYYTGSIYNGVAQVTSGGSNGNLLLQPSGGNVGIGTTAPGAKLSLGQIVGVDLIRLYDSGSGSYGFGIQGSELQAFIPTAAHFSFNTGGTVQSSGANELMRISGSGNVGIGTISPQALLDVAGSIRPGQYTVATLPAAGTAGRIAYVSNMRVLTAGGTLQGAGAGTGGVASDNGTNWQVAGTAITAQA